MGKAKPVAISVTEAFCRAVDRAAALKGMSRSAYIVQAVEMRMLAESPEGLEGAREVIDAIHARAIATATEMVKRGLEPPGRYALPM